MCRSFANGKAMEFPFAFCQFTEGGEAQPFPLLIRIPAHAVHQQRGPRAHGTEGRRLVLQVHARAKGLPKPGMGNFDMDV